MQTCWEADLIVRPIYRRLVAGTKRVRKGGEKVKLFQGSPRRERREKGEEGRRD